MNTTLDKVGELCMKYNMRMSGTIYEDDYNICFINTPPEEFYKKLFDIDGIVMWQCSRYDICFHIFDGNTVKDIII